MAYFQLLISSNATAMKCEKKFSSTLLLSKFKENIVLITGCDNRSVTLELRDDSEKHIAYLTDDSKTLGELGVENGFHIHASDPTVESGLYDKILHQDNVENLNFGISDKQYAEREDTLLAWKKRNKIGKFKEVDAEEVKRLEEENAAQVAAEIALLESMHIGDRCEVRVPKQSTKRGEVAFLGKTKFKDGLWVGVKYDEPLGRNDGSVDGVHYFDCPPKYGAFVKPACVQVGDFPEIGFDDLDEI